MAAWTPTAAAATDRAVVFWKSGPESHCADVERVVEAHGLRPLRIRYGTYEASTYRQALDGAAIAIFLSAFETQGLALAEAWAMNVPTLVWNPCAPAEWRGWRFRAGSSAPYLTSETGAFWRSLDDLNAALNSARSGQREWHPRDWVLAHLTDAVCARQLFATIEDVSRLAALQ